MVVCNVTQLFIELWGQRAAVRDSSGSSGDDEHADDQESDRTRGTRALDRAQARLIGETLPDEYVTDTFDSILEDGAIFEVTWSDGGDTHTAIVTHVPVERPAAAPLHGSPVYRFRQIGDGQQWTIPVDSIDSLQAIEVAALPADMADGIAESLVSLADTSPDRIQPADVATLLSRVTTTEGIGASLEIARTVLAVQSEPPDTLLEATVDILTNGLGHTHWEDPAIALPAARCLVHISETDPTVPFDLVPNLALAADCGDSETKRHAIYVLAKVAEEYPAEVYPAMDQFVTGLATDDSNIQTNSLTALGRITQSFPDAAEPVAAEVASLFTDETPKVRANAVGIFGDMAVDHPSLVLSYGEELLAALQDDDPSVRRNSSIALVRAGAADPEMFADHSAVLVAALDDESPEVRRNMCTIIGNVAPDIDADRLHALANEDPDESVRKQAKWAASKLEMD